MSEAQSASMLPPAQRTIPGMLQAQAAKYGGRRLAVFDGVEWTYEDVLAVAARSAGRLAAWGVAAGDKVAVMCGNRPEFLEVFLGCAWLGAVCVPINTASRGPQLQHILGDSRSILLIIDAENLEALAGLDHTALGLRAIWVTDPWPGDGGDARLQPFPPPGPLREAAAQRPGDTSAILYTSGTTGPSKGACSPHAQFYWWGVNLAEMVGLRDGDVFLTALPLFHSNALCTFFVALLNGATVVYERRFSVSTFFDTARRQGATVVSLIGAMVPMLLSTPPSPDDRKHSIRIAQGGAVPRAHGEAFTERFGFHLVEGYGATETNVVIAWDLNEPLYGAMGRVKPGFEVRLVDEDDNEVPPGEPGELVLRPKEPFSIFTGYFGMAEHTAAQWRNLWFHTGDRAVCDDTGLYRFVDRTKDSIKRRGENISALEVQDVLRSHPKIQEAAVFPVPSELAEDEVMAVILAKADEAAPTPGEIVDFCEGKMPYFAIPRFIELAADLPLTATGKVEKYKLRQRGVTAATWDRVAAGHLLARERARNAARHPIGAGQSS